jgi:acyl dehydratase/NAD(P)-dependent dehydrogenase (short-subunit alcohol dehydrogenase family)
MTFLCRSNIGKPRIDYDTITWTQHHPMGQPNSRAFTIPADRSQAFARLSGDFNPLHVDPVMARRSHFGGTVVHGVHALLCTLDLWAAEHGRTFALQSVQVKFHGAILTGGANAVEWEASGPPGKFTFAVHGRHGLAQRCVVRYDEIPGKPPETMQPAVHRSGGPAVLSFEQSVAYSGEVNLGMDTALAAELFPHLCRWMPLEQLAVLLGTTRIVGMECPGLLSLFRKIEVDFSRQEPGCQNDRLSYRVTDADARFSMVTIGIRCGGAMGRLDAMFRPAPVRQKSFTAVQFHCAGGDFRGQRAMIIGGSRGLGELTAKLIAAGAGESWISYASGESDALNLQAEIQANGGAARVFRFDVLRPPDTIPAALQGAGGPTHLYFFATPAIILNQSGIWDSALFQYFCDFYIAGVTESIRTIRSWWPGTPLVLFYPSTVFIDTPEPGAAEYAAAKSAGEVLCRYLETADSKLRCTIARLPRMLTDQTNAPGLDPEALPSALEILRDILVRIHAASNRPG